jgi:hypothetical protein
MNNWFQANWKYVFFVVAIALLLQLYREKVVFLQQEALSDFCDDYFQVNGEPLHIVFFIVYEQLISCESKIWKNNALFSCSSLHHCLKQNHQRGSFSFSAAINEVVWPQLIHTAARKGEESMAWIVHVGVDAIIVFCCEKFRLKLLVFLCVCGGGSASCFYW